MEKTAGVVASLGAWRLLPARGESLRWRRLVGPSASGENGGAAGGTACARDERGDRGAGGRVGDAAAGAPAAGDASARAAARETGGWRRERDEDERKISELHRRRRAVVYMRQSSPVQVAGNLESAARQSRSAPTRRRARDHRARLEGPTPPAPRLDPDGATPQAPDDHRRRRRARARRILLGGRDHRLAQATSTRWSRWRPPGPSRQSIRDTPMGSRPPGSVTPVARRRALRRNPVLRYPTRAYG